MWLDLIIAMSCGGAGLVCGWIMNSTGVIPLVTSETESTPHKTPENTDAVVEVESRRERISEVAERLRSYARSMAADVDAHQTAVQAVSNRLTADQTGSPEAVFEAINKLIEANELMQSQLHSAQDRIQDQAMQIESAERRAETDALTRVPNRGAFDKHFNQQHAKGAGYAGTLAILDVDHFKKFNDVYGHRAGDEVLRVVAGILHSRLDKYGIVARFGGEEFAIILDGCPVDKAKDLVDAARAAIGAREIPFEDKRLRVTASAGAAELMEDERPESWLQRADDGLYRSKEEGRDCGHWMDGVTPIRINPTTCDGVLENEDSKLKPKDAKSVSPSSSGETAINSALESNEAVENEGKPKTFANLPDRNALSEGYRDVCGRTQSTVSMFVMAIRCNSQAGTSSMRSLMQIVRATLRSVDQLGCDDESTFLVFMPSVDEATAKNRGLQICHSASAIGLGKGDASSNPISIGVSQARSGEDFDSVVDRCVELAGQAKDSGSDAVLMEIVEQFA